MKRQIKMQHVQRHVELSCQITMYIYFNITIFSYVCWCFVLEAYILFVKNEFLYFIQTQRTKLNKIILCMYNVRRLNNIKGGIRSKSMFVIKHFNKIVLQSQFIYIHLLS